jgi:CRP-like cAMP-binding protein
MKSDHKSSLIPIEVNRTVCAECSIRRLALFHGVPEDELEWTQEYRSGQFRVKARKEIYCEAQSCEHLFTLYHGWVALYKTLNNGKRQILRIALPGDMLGFQPNLLAPLTHSAVSLTDSVLCGFPRTAMPDLLRRNTNVARRLTELNARDMNVCQSRLLTIGQQSAIERIAFFCCELYYRLKMIYNNVEHQEIFFPLSQEDIGDATGLTKIHVNRTLRSLREQGLMQISGKQLTIHDLEGLSELGHFDPASIYIHPLY